VGIGDGGRRRAALRREFMRGAVPLNGFGTVSWGTDGRTAVMDHGCRGSWILGFLATGPDFWFGCLSPPVFGGFLAKLHIGYLDTIPIFK